MFKSGFVTIVGEPNAGKSTLLNTILKNKVSIVTRRKNTTRKQIRGIYNSQDCQIVFLDTPGFTNKKTKLDNLLRKIIIESVDGVDLIYFLIPFWKQIDIESFKKFKLSGNNIFALITQVDRSSNKDEILSLINSLNETKIFKEIIPISSTRKINIDTLIKLSKPYLSNTEKFYDPEVVSDLPDATYYAEVIREKLLIFLNNEIPHNLFVKVIKVGNKKDLLEIYAKIIVNRTSHKSIVIGRNGSKLQEVGTSARKELEKKKNKKVFLGLEVVVKENWIDNSELLKEI